MEVNTEQEKKRQYWREYKQAHKVETTLSQQKWRAVPANRLKVLCLVKGRGGVSREGLDFEELLARMETNGWCCELTGVEFDFSSPRNPYTLSIDRINTGLGYTNNNVRLVCWWINCAMGTWGLDKLKELVKELNHRDQPI